jgi:hypothetical protein
VVAAGRKHRAVPATTTILDENRRCRMPFIWVLPDIAAEKGDRTIYHVYKDDLEMEFWFTADPHQDDSEVDYGEPDYRFDIRDVDLPAAVRQLATQQQLEYIIEHALVPFPEDRE